MCGRRVVISNDSEGSSNLVSPTSVRVTAPWLTGEFTRERREDEKVIKSKETSGFFCPLDSGS
jgi:hypothetical protein